MDARAGLTADDVRTAAFSKPPFGERGYHEDEVDDFLERLERRLVDPRAVREPTAADVALTRFSKPPLGKRGYHEDEVDALMARAVAQLERTDGAVPFRPPSRPAAAAAPVEAPALDAAPRRKWWPFR